MDKNNSELAEFMAGLGSSDKTDPLEQKENDPFNHLEEKKEEVLGKEGVKEDKPLPFNKDPKVQKFIEKEISKRLENFKSSESPREQQKEDDEVVESLIAVIGNDTPEKRRAVEALRDRLDEGTRRIAEWENQQQLAKQAEIEAEQELETAFENIETNYEIDFSTTLGKKVRQEFASFVEKIAPKDSEGNVIDYPDMNSAWETFSELKKSTAQPSRAKELASRSMQRSSETSSEPILKRSRTPFSNSDAFIESLSR